MLLNSLQLDRVEPLHCDEPADKIYDAFVRRSHARGIAVVDGDRRPVGLIGRDVFLQNLSGPYGRALNARKRASDLMEPDPLVAPANADLDVTMASLERRGEDALLTGFIVVDSEGRYFGLAHGISVMRAMMAAKADLVDRLQSQADSLNLLNGRLSREVREREDAERLAKRLSEVDPLTELVNRRRFMFDFERLVGTGRPVAVIFIDLDRFKAINDRHNHLVGDGLLQVVARRIEAVASEAVVSRLGGDEFGLIVSTGVERAQLESLCEQLERSISAPADVAGVTVQVGASIGVAVFPNDGLKASDVLLGADLAMLSAKRSGGGYLFYSAEIQRGFQPTSARAVG